MAGPWFTVQEDKSKWQKLETIWISNGKTNELADVELRTAFAPVPTPTQFK